MPSHEPTPRGQAGEPGPASVEEDTLLRAVAGGHDDAFDALYDLVAPSAYGVVLSVVRDPAQAQEVVQEALFETWRTAERFDPGRGSARSWVLTIARRRAVDHVRAARAATDRDVAVGAREAARDYDDVVDAVETRLAHHRVRQCLQGLTSLQREALTLAFYRGLTHREVSATLDVPLGTVKTRLRDGLIRLRDCLGAW